MLKSTVLLAILGLALGSPSPGGRIVGGDDASIEEYPYTLVLMSNNQFFCGAVLIDEEWAITAASCVNSATASQLSVRAGSSSQSSGGQTVSVSNVIVHPEYDSSTNDYDYALLQLAERVTAEDAEPARLEEDRPVEDGEEAVVVGWGTLEYGGDTSDTLQAAEVTVVDSSTCQSTYGSSISITERMICAGDGTTDACQGDSGGPLVAGGSVIGLVSFGPRACATAGYPGVYSSLPAVIPWIFEEISGEPTGSPPSDFPTPPSDFPTDDPDFPTGSPPSDFPTDDPDFPTGSPPSDFPTGEPDFPTGSPPTGEPEPPIRQS